MDGPGQATTCNERVLPLGEVWRHVLLQLSQEDRTPSFSKGGANRDGSELLPRFGGAGFGEQDRFKVRPRVRGSEASASRRSRSSATLTIAYGGRACNISETTWSQAHALPGLTRPMTSLTSVVREVTLSEGGLCRGGSEGAGALCGSGSGACSSGQGAGLAMVLWRPPGPATEAWLASGKGASTPACGSVRVA